MLTQNTSFSLDWLNLLFFNSSKIQFLKKIIMSSSDGIMYVMHVLRKLKMLVNKTSLNAWKDID